MDKSFVVLYLLYCFNSVLVISEASKICNFRGRHYKPGNKWTVSLGDKTLDCSCSERFRVSCNVNYNAPVECYERSTRQSHQPGDEWSRMEGGRRLTCTCTASGTSATISCTDNDRCQKGGRSYAVGETFTHGEISGVPASCVCLGAGKVTCSATVEEEPEESEQEQTVREIEIRGGKSFHPRIKSLQACDSGHQIIVDGGRWNRTATSIDGRQYKEECVCENAIVTCNEIRTVGRVEPICISIDGRIKKVREEWIQVYTSRPTVQFVCKCYGHRRKHCRRARTPKCVDEDGTIYSAREQWPRIHESFSNIRFNCICRSNWTIQCTDAGYCEKLKPPVNGAMICAEMTSLLGTQKYCRPLCLEGYEFTVDTRFHRTIEVCGYSNLHRWSGGYADDPLTIARCIRRTPGTRKRGRSWMYLPSDNCPSVSMTEQRELGRILLRQLNISGFCRNSCQIEYFECGVKSVMDDL